MENNHYCLVLSGGGAKGVYHIGVWKALKELGIQVDAFIGNSIGAVISAFLAQGLDEVLEVIGGSIGLDYVLNIPKDLIVNGELNIRLNKKDAFKEFYRSVLAKRGLDTSPFRTLLETHINEDCIRRGGKDFGVVSFNLSEMKPREVYIEEMEEGELINYVLASSAFPGFERPEIGGKKYIDGGVYDNIPYAMARSRGYKNIIVVDISGIGVKKKMNIEGVRMVYIKNSINMGRVLDFDRKFLDEFTQLGYLDTMRTFGQLTGFYYFIIPNTELEESFKEYLKSVPAQSRIISRAMTLNKNYHPSTAAEAVRLLFPKRSRFDRQWLPVFVDCAAKSLSLKRIRKWKYDEIFEEMLKQEESVRVQFHSMIARDRKKIEASIRKEIRKKSLIKTPYIYHLLVEHYLHERLKKPLNRLLSERFPELATGVCFLEMMQDFITYESTQKDNAATAFSWKRDQ